MSSLHNTLIDLNELKQNYNISIPYNDIISINDICFAMIDRITANELLSDEITLNIIPYCKKHGLNYEKILYQYIKLMINKQASNLLVERGVIIFKLINTIEIKTGIITYILESGIFLIDNYSKLYPNIINTLINDIMLYIDIVDEKNRNHIIEQSHYIMLHSIISKYNITNYNINDKTSTYVLINYIISQVQLPNVLKDSMLLLPLYPSINIIDLYTQYIFNIINSPENMLLFLNEDNNKNRSKVF